MAPSIVLKDWEGDIPFADDFKKIMEEDENAPSSTLVNQALNSNLLPSAMHGTFLSALDGLPKSRQVRNWRGQFTSRMAEVDDNEERNWISEMIQNARDVNALQIDIKLTESSLVFGHDGDEFKPEELAALLGISMTTKSGDVATIGKFGIGFKYWHTHFQRIAIVAWSNGVRHTLTMTGMFNSEDSKYEFCDDTEHDSRTEFRFDGPENQDAWDIYRQSGTDGILGPRVAESLPFLQSGSQPVTISVESNGNQSAYSCEIVGDLSTNNIGLHQVNYGESNDPKNALRARVKLSYFEDLEPQHSQTLKNKVASEYEETDTVIEMAAKANRPTAEIAREKAESAFDSTFISLLLTPENPQGGISSLFIASDEEVNCAYIADAPWKLNDSRLELSWTGPNWGWNRLIVQLVDRLYSELMRACLADVANFGLDYSEMYELLNRPLGSGDTPGVQNFRASSIDHLSQTLGLTGDEYHCSDALIWLWKKLVSANQSDARKWLEDAMHEDLATTGLVNGAKCPIRHSHSTFSEIYDQPNPCPLSVSECSASVNTAAVRCLRHGGVLPEICESLGDGIPDEISSHVDDIRTNSSPDAPELDSVLALFDDVVTDVSNNFHFLREVEPSLISELPDWGFPEGTLLREVLEHLDAALPSAQAHFRDPSKNLVGHTRKSANPLVFGELMQKLARVGYDASADPANLPALDAFLDCLIANRPSDLSWGRAVLAPTPLEEETPLLVLLPPPSHVVAVAMGGEQSHTLSMHSPTLLNNKVRIDFDSPPEILHWGSGIDPETVYIRTAEIPQVGRARNPVGGTWDWSDFALNYLAITGWDWPVVTFEHLEDQHRLDVLNRSTPVFIDALHPDTDSGHGVHMGLRTRDSNANITYEQEPLHHYVTRVDRDVDCMSDDDGVPMEIMSAAVSLEGAQVENYRTNGDAARPIPRFEGETPHVHGIFRVLGILSKLAEDEPVIGANDEERLRRLHLYSWWTEELSDSTKKLARQFFAFDVIWVRGSQQICLGLCAKYIPWPGLGTPTYLGDDDEPRNRESVEFQDLAAGGLVGFQEKRYNRPYEHHRNMFPTGHLWLPRSEDSSPDDVPPNHFNKWLDIDPLRLRLDDEIRQILTTTSQIDAQNILRPGLNRLLEVIFGNNPTNTTDGLDWLEELLTSGLPTPTWLDAVLPTGQQTNRTLLKTKLDTADKQARYPRIWEAVQTVNLKAAWDRFVMIAFLDGDAERVLDAVPDARIPMLVESGELWSTDKNIGPTIRSLAEEDLGEVHVMVSQRDDFPRTLFDIEANVNVHIVASPQILTALEGVCANNNNQIVEVVPHLTLEGEVTPKDNPIPSSQINPKIRYVDEMLRGLVNMGRLQAEINWYSHDDRAASANGHPLIPADHCPALEWEDRPDDPPVIHISDIHPDAKPSFTAHEIIAEWLLSYLEGKGITEDDVTGAVERYEIVSPWWFTIPIPDVNHTDKTVEFNLRYCWDQLAATQLTQKLAGIQDDNDLENALNELEDMYRNDSPALLHSNIFLAGLYQGIPSIITDWWSGSFGPQHTVAVRNHIDIASHMLSAVTSASIPSDDLSSIGACLRVSAHEQSAFTGHALNFDPSVKIAFDFSEDVRDRLHDAIFGQWFDARDDFILVVGMFVRNDGGHDDGKLHKHHALHILAFLYAKLGVT